MKIRIEWRLKFIALTSTPEESVHGCKKDNADSAFYRQEAKDKNCATYAAYHYSVHYSILVYDQVWHYSTNGTTTVEDR
jgi:hypothetical protein